MSTELATTTPGQGAMSLPDKMRYAEALASASLLPAQYREKPGNVLLAMELGDALGIPPIQAINDVHVIEGKPSASANLIGAMVRKAGHKLRVSGDDSYATAQIIRADDPDFTFEVTWTLDRAKTAGLLPGKPTSNWAKYPAAMLKARAITECARAATPDALYGVIYTPEELGSTVTEDGVPVANPNPRPAAQPADPQGGGSKIAQARQRAQSQGKAASAPSAPSPATAEPEAPQEPAAPAEPMCDQGMWKQISHALDQLDVTAAADKVSTVSDMIGRQITRGGEMTAAEARSVIDALDPTAGGDGVVDAEVVDEDGVA
ncbi:hypothetical protein ABDK96_01900 [Citricoccus nitrophenolicus]|uniref:Uncharacterized protein n=1 Tax=Citricoccus nitrophenolicus TaxID=863575 RepID=A0ABV0IFY5_9MICC